MAGFKNTNFCGNGSADKGEVPEYVEHFMRGGLRRHSKWGLREGAELVAALKGLLNELLEGRPIGGVEFAVDDEDSGSFFGTL